MPKSFLSLTPTQKTQYTLPPVNSQIKWTDGFGREWGSKALASFVDAGRVYTVVRHPLSRTFIVLDYEQKREV